MTKTFGHTSFIIALLLFFTLSYGQNKIDFKDSQQLKSFRLEVAYQKTVSLIFPAGIQSVDIGSGDVIADKFEGVENVLRVKANTNMFFPETNLSVITKDGKFYSFYVVYTEDPPVLSYQLNGNDFSGVSRKFFMETQDGSLAPVSFEEVQMNQADMAFYSRKILEKNREMKHLGMRAFDIVFSLEGIYIRENVIFYSFNIENKSNINYDIDFIKFYIRDKKVFNRTAIQEMELQPLFKIPDIDTVSGKKRVKMVFALQKFTIPEDKNLEVEMFEKNGGRHMKFSVANDDIINANLIK